MSFFDAYDVTLLDHTTTSDEPHRIRFLQKWRESPHLCIPLHPQIQSRFVTPPMLALNEMLKKTKCDIDAFHGFDPAKEQYYNQVTRLIDPFAFYRKQIKRNVHPPRTMTNAWLKCWEMIHVFRLVPTSGHVRLFCNAELPGAFLYALHHFIKSKTHTTYEWLANSLYPSDGTILGDEFGLVQRYPNHWLMSKEHDGSVTNPVMIQCIEDRCKRTIDLYTSDIGIGLEHDTFLKQEELEAPLHLGQILCGLRSLREGGHLVCKTFMFFHPFSISLMYLTSQCFDECYVYKPQTSRAANSEVYLVGKGFRIRPDIISILMHTLTTWTNASIDAYMVPVPEDAYLTIFLALHRIYQRQIAYINTNIRTVSSLYESGVPADFNHVRNTQVWQSEQERLHQWKRHFPIPSLPFSQSL